MLKHIVMYKLKNPTQQNIAELVEVFNSMKGKIEVLKEVRAGADILCSARSFDVVLECTFDNVQALEEYAKHPVHLPIVDYVRGIVEKSHSVDYIY